jgi:hypothetical protein
MIARSRKRWGWRLPLLTYHTDSNTGHSTADHLELRDEAAADRVP